MPGGRADRRADGLDSSPRSVEGRGVGRAGPDRFGLADGLFSDHLCNSFGDDRSTLGVVYGFPLCGGSTSCTLGAII